MNTVSFRPLGNRYLVLPTPIEGESETIGDVTLSTPKDPHKQSVEGTVVARGKSCTELEIGDKVFFGQFSGYDQHLDGTDFKVLQENEILGQKLFGYELSPPQVPLTMEMPGGYTIPVDAFPVSNEPTHILTIREVEPPPSVPYVCDQCFRSDGKPHYAWCPTLVPVEAAPEPDRTPLGEAALIPEDDIPW